MSTSSTRHIACAAALPGWTKSSYSGPEDCVEVTEAPAYQAVAVRDSKNPTGPAILLPPAAFAAFVREAAASSVR